MKKIDVGDTIEKFLRIGIKEDATFLSAFYVVLAVQVLKGIVSGIIIGLMMGVFFGVKVAFVVGVGVSACVFIIGLCIFD